MSCNVQNYVFSNYFTSMDHCKLCMNPSADTVTDCGNSNLLNYTSVVFHSRSNIHEGVVKQIVGSTLEDSNTKDKLVENFVSNISSKEYADMYKHDGLIGGHVIMLGANCELAAKDACNTFPDGFHVGGGINTDNYQQFFDAGASHVIVTSFVFQDGNINFERLQDISKKVGKSRLVIDISCRKNPSHSDGLYYVVTNKWTKFTNFALNCENLNILSQYCDEFLVHGVDMEGKMSGIECELVEFLGKFCTIPVTYAGGIRSIEDLELINHLGGGKVDFTVGSALDIFGGNLRYKDVVCWHTLKNPESSR